MDTPTVECPLGMLSGERRCSYRRLESEMMAILGEAPAATCRVEMTERCLRCGLLITSMVGVKE